MSDFDLFDPIIAAMLLAAWTLFVVSKVSHDSAPFGRILVALLVILVSWTLGTYAMLP